MLLLGTLTFGCHEVPKAPTASQWTQITARLDEIPLGMDVAEVERRLALPPPFKTVLGSSTYHDRVFMYRVTPDILISIGLRQEGPEIERDKGRFKFNGHFSVSSGDELYWNRWEYADGRLLESWSGLEHLRPDLGARWPTN